MSIRSVVVLPAPLGPRKPKISPRCTSKLTPRTASTVAPAGVEALAQLVGGDHSRSLCVPLRDELGATRRHESGAAAAARRLSWIARHHSMPPSAIRR